MRKTVITAGLCQAAAMITAKKESPPTPVHYIKPIQTGELLDVDFVKKHGDIKTSQLFFALSLLNPTGSYKRRVKLFRAFQVSSNNFTRLSCKTPPKKWSM